MYVGAILRPLIYAITIAAPMTVSAVPGNSLAQEPVKLFSAPGLVQSSEPLIQGMKARRAAKDDWPGTLYQQFDSEMCTATFVGPHTLLVAAHCTWSDQPIEFEFRGRTYRGKCSPHSDFRPWKNENSAAERKAASFDLALCEITNGPVQGIKYERIGDLNFSLQVGSPIRVVGFGCNDIYQSTGAGELRYADLEITRAAGQDNYVETGTLSEGSTTLCAGDSGGAAYVQTGADVYRRVIVAVNSHTSPKFGKLTGISYLSSLQSPEAREYLRKWTSGGSHRTICGLNYDAVNCR